MQQMSQIWFNLTSSHNWSRPPVGIIRVEQSIYKGLCQLCGSERIIPCVWRDGEFRRTDNSGSNEKPPPGSILITMGLDWDQPYKETLFDLRKKHSVTVIACCYDLIPILFPQYCVGEVAAYFKEYFAAVSWGASGVLCISRNSEKDYLELCRESGWPTPPTCVMPLGDNLPEEKGEITNEVLTLCSQPLILFVSTIERRKNHQCLVQAYHLLRRTRPDLKLPKLVFVGMPGWGVGDLLKDIELDPLTKDYIVLLHHVSDAELRALYKAAALCLYPSFYEGWGLPLGEALAMGKPVFSSDAGSLPEVGGDLVRYLSPFNPSAWADAISNALDNPQTLDEQASRVTTEYRAREWKATAAVVLNFAEQCHVLNSAGKFPLVLNPGYDFSSLSGMRIGPFISATPPQVGFIMFGPYLSIPQGRYYVTVEGSTEEPAKGDLLFDVCAGDKTSPETLIYGELSVQSATNSLLWTSETFFSETPLTNLQVRCLLRSPRHVAIHRVTIHSQPN
jgi:glycosyltransferase involved in cell wall biosynthesis